jgi:hypothetical protein
MVYKGSCHCGNVKYEVDAELTGAMACNCSICQRKGALLWFVPRDKMTLLSGDDAMTTYKFNKHLIEHRFCSTCGIHPFAEGVDPAGNKMAAININCLEDVDLSKVPVQHYDGRSKA